MRGTAAGTVAPEPPTACVGMRQGELRGGRGTSKKDEEEAESAHGAREMTSAMSAAWAPSEAPKTSDNAARNSGSPDPDDARTPTLSLLRIRLRGTSFLNPRLSQSTVPIGQTRDARHIRGMRGTEAITGAPGLPTASVGMRRGELRGGRGTGHKEDKEAETSRGAREMPSATSTARAPSEAPETSDDAA